MVLMMEAKKSSSSFRFNKEILALVKIEAAKDRKSIRQWVEELIRAEFEKRGIEVKE
jgi:predicted HicB family RNase H-like nuclease